ncbi:hypothetical protein AMECASPLE_039664, partial [Ameca splendens]
GIELVQCFTAGTKTTLLLLKQMFDYQLDSPLQHPGVCLTREGEECDPPIVGTHPPVPLLVKGEHHTGLPVQRHCPRLPCNVEERCQPRQPHNIQRLQVLMADFIHPEPLPL